MSLRNRIVALGRLLSRPDKLSEVYSSDERLSKYNANLSPNLRETDESVLRVIIAGDTVGEDVGTLMGLKLARHYEEFALSFPTVTKIDKGEWVWDEGRLRRVSQARTYEVVKKAS